MPLVILQYLYSLQIKGDSKKSSETPHELGLGEPVFLNDISRNGQLSGIRLKAVPAVWRLWEHH
jgi:hypothetical protein